MTWVWVLLAVAATLLVVWAIFTARRLDRLHVRLDRSRDSLAAALDRRMAVVAAVAPSLAGAAREAEAVGFEPGRFASRLAAEQSVITALPADAAANPELARADERVALALRFYNDAVAVTRAVRLKPGVRALRLAGTAPMPEFCPPPGFVSG